MDLCIVDKQVNEHNLALGTIHSNGRRYLIPNHH
jgi:hypothetical protein